MKLVQNDADWYSFMVLIHRNKMWPIIFNVPISPFSINNCCIWDKESTNEGNFWLQEKISCGVVHVNNRSFVKRTVSFFADNPPESKNDDENPQPPNQSSSKINNPNKRYSSTTPKSSIESKREVGEDVATTTETIATTFAFIASTWTINNDKTPLIFSNNQVFLPQIIYSKHM